VEFDHAVERGVQGRRGGKACAEPDRGRLGAILQRARAAANFVLARGEEQRVGRDFIAIVEADAAIGLKRAHDPSSCNVRAASLGGGEHRFVEPAPGQPDGGMGKVDLDTRPGCDQAQAVDRMCF